MTTVSGQPAGARGRRAVRSRRVGSVVVPLVAVLVAAVGVGSGPASAASKSAGVASAVKSVASVKPASSVRASAAAVADPVSADVLPSPQVNGTVFAAVIRGNVAYVGGNFTEARPFGVAPGGVGEVARTNLLAFDVTTGALLSWAPVVTGTPFAAATSPGSECDSLAAGRWVCDSVLSLALSPDGKTLYAGGDFTAVGGVNRYRVAAFATASGALTGFAPAASSRVRAIAPAASRVYLGGSFTVLSSVAKARLAAVDLTGKLIAGWNASADRGVRALALATDGTRVVVGGSFTTLSGQRRQSLGAVGTGTGVAMPWQAPLPVDADPLQQLVVTGLAVDGAHVFASTSTATADGVDSANSGVIRRDLATGVAPQEWPRKGGSSGYCAGGVQAVTVLRQVVYAASRYLQCGPLTGVPPSLQFRRLEALYDSGFDDNLATEIGVSAATPAAPGTWAVASDGTHLLLGGSFTSVSRSGQQGIALFEAHSVAPKKVGPQTPFPAAVATAAATGGVNVSVQSTWDPDGYVTYQLFRDDVSTALQTTPPSGLSFSNRQPITFFDTTVPQGSTHRYRVRAVDDDGNRITSPQSAAVTAAVIPKLTYPLPIGKYVPLAQTISGTPLPSRFAMISADGALVAWNSADDGQVPGDNDHQIDAFVKNLRTGAVTRLTGRGGTFGRAVTAMSRNGRYLVSCGFVTTGDFPFPVPTDWLLHDRVTGTVTPVPASSASWVSNDARFIGFGGTQRAKDADLVLDRKTGTFLSKAGRLMTDERRILYQVKPDPNGEDVSWHAFDLLTGTDAVLWSGFGTGALMSGTSDNGLWTYSTVSNAVTVNRLDGTVPGRTFGGTEAPLEFADDVSALVARQSAQGAAATGVVVGNVVTGAEFVATGPEFDGEQQVTEVSISGDGSMVLFAIGGVSYVLRMR